jgi:hypothetical protein
VIGMDISLDYIRENLFNDQDVPGIKEYLLNSQGRIVLSSDFKYERAETNNKDATLIEKNFPFRGEFLVAVSRKKMIFQAEKYGTKYIFALNRIPSLGYYYVEQSSEKTFKQVWTQKEE